MSTDINALIERARVAATQRPGDAAGGGNERARLQKVAQEFESMLLTQMLSEMRKAGQWDDEESGEKDTFGAETMFETLDTELAQHLTKAQGLGLAPQLLQSFDRMQAAIDLARGATAVELEKPAVAQSAIVPAAPNLNAAAAGALKRSDYHGGTAAKVELTPVEGKVTSAFGWRHDPFTGQAKFHKGIDLRAAYGQDIKAAADGRVVFSGTQRGYGNTVLVEHADGTRTRYAHLSATLVEAGDKVGAGQPIGQAGHSGRATGTHLHFEVIAADGKVVDPQATRQMAMRATGQSESSGG